MSKPKSRTSKISVLAIGVLLAFALSLIFTVSNRVSAFAAEANSASFIDTKVYSKATVDEDFADDTILVTLNGMASKKLKDYAVTDFPELNLIGIKDLTAPTVELAKKQITAERTRNWGELQSRADAQMLLNVDEFRQILCLTLREGGKENVLKAIKTLEAREDIIAAEPNYRIQGEAVPHATLYNAANQWGLNDVSHGIRAQEAWNITTGVNTVTVGIVDSGIDANHPDLTNRIHRSNPHNINTTLHRDYVDGAAGNNFAIVDPVGPHWHGTHVSGIVGAEWNNANSISGVAWNVRLVSLRVLDATNSGWQADIVSAVAFAGGAGIRVLNVSIGGGTYTTAQQTTLRNYPGLMVCSAGNDNRNSNLTTSTDPGNPSFPGSFDFDNILSVGATTWDINVTPNVERRATNPDFGWGIGRGSNWGSTAVDVFAPGTNIRSTVPGGGYRNESGTSMATPMVTGIAALMLSVNQNLTVAQIKSTIINNVDPVTNLSGLCISSGRVNAFKAVSAVAFTTGTATGGISIATRTGFSFPNNTNLVLPDRFAPVSKTVPTAQQNVTAIGNNAFANQDQLSQITIPASVTSIGESAFSGCDDLVNVNFGENSQLTIIGAHSFSYCSKLGSTGEPFVVPSGVTTIESTTFLSCVELTGIILPSGIEYCGNYAFYDCWSLTIYFSATRLPYDWNGNCNPSNRPYYRYSTIPSKNTWHYVDGKPEVWIVHTVTLYLNGGGGIAGTIPNIPNNSVISCPETPTLAGNVFCGWYKDAQLTIPWEFEYDTITANTNLYAKWTPEIYSITYLDGGSIAFSGIHGGNSPSTHTFGTTTALVNPTKAGFNFGGWYISSDCSGVALSSISATGYSSDITLYAKWAPITYSISYLDKGGEIFSGTLGSNSPSTHTFGATTALVNPTKAGYDFGGWYISSDSSGVALSFLSATVYTSNITLYAKWTPEVIVTFDKDGGDGIANRITLVYGQTYGTLPSVTRDGYTFGGWWTEANGGGSQVTGATILLTVSDHTLYAKWIFEATPGLTYTYDASSDSYSVSKGAFDPAGIVYIPAFYNGKSVTGISVNGFSYCTNLTGVVIQGGSGSFSIGDNAFEFCENLKFVVLGNSTTGILRFSFLGCGSLTSITIPDSVVYIGSEVFNWCSYLAEGFTIYAEADSLPAGWEGGWDTLNIWYIPETPVIWGCTLSEDKSYLVSFDKTSSSTYSYMVDPFRLGYTFAGWTTVEGGTTATCQSAYDIYQFSNGTTLYAVWIEE